MLEKAVMLLRGMAYEHRLRILIMLQQGAQSLAALAEEIAAEPTAIAHHLRFLRDSRLIRRRRIGRQAYYALHSDLMTDTLNDRRGSAPEAGDLTPIGTDAPAVDSAPAADDIYRVQDSVAYLAVGDKRLLAEV